MAIQVKGGAYSQKLNFSLPGLPEKFRIDLGETGNEEEVIIEKIIIKHKGISIPIDQNVMHRFFKINIYGERTPWGYKRMSVGNRYDPFIESTALLHKKMELTYRYN